MLSGSITGIPAEDGLHPGIPDTVYHSDHNSLSSSGARLLLAECPAIFDHRRKEPPDPKPQYDFGHAAHKMVLGEGPQLAVLDPAIHGRTKDGEIAKSPAATASWKEADAKARELGKIVITKAQMDVAQRMAGKVFANRYAAKLLESGRAEQSGYWRDEATDTRLRCRPDWLPDRPGRLICTEYKTAISANPEHFKRAALDYGYHQQAAWYLDGLRALGISDDAAFLFIVQMKTSPFLVSLIQLDPAYLEIGRRRNRQAIDLYAQCAADDSWPDFGDGIHTVGPPRWALSQLESDLAA